MLSIAMTNTAEEQNTHSLRIFVEEKWEGNATQRLRKEQLEFIDCESHVTD